MRCLPALVLLSAASVTGCAVDAAGLGASRSDPDLGATDMQVVLRDDGSVPDAGPADMAQPDLSVDAFVPPPDMCVSMDEICNGVDDDCDGAIDDGLVSVPCDGDGDGCDDGVSGCAGGSETCTGDDPERAGDPCDGPDADDAEEGTLSCDSGGLVCTGDCVEETEVCDRRDNDCDGEADEGDVCGNGGTSCTGYTYGGSAYLFCTESGGGDGWFDARDECRSLGYELVQVDDEAELTFLRMHTGSENWWTDGRANTGESDDWNDPARWFWETSGDPVAASLWVPGEPSGNGRCAYLWNANDHRLDDAGCGNRRQFICEAPILP